VGRPIKTAPRLRIGKTWQAGQILKGAVGLQKGSRFQTIQTEDNGIDQGQQHLGKTVALVASGVGQMASDESPDLQHSGKFVKEMDAPIMRQNPYGYRRFLTFSAIGAF